MRRIGKFFNIVIIGLLLTVLAIFNIVSKYTIDKDNIQKTLDKSGAYTVINDEIKKQVTSSLMGSKYKEIKQLNINEFVDYVIKEDILKDEVDYVLTQLYDNGKLMINKKILYDGYVTNINNYIKEKNIKLPNDVRKELNNNVIDNSLTEEDITPKNNSYLRLFNEGKDLIKSTRLVLIAIISVLLILTVVLCKEKLRGVYIPFIFSGLLLLLINCGARIAINSLNLTLQKAKLTQVLDIIKKSIFTTMNWYCGVFLAIGLAGIVAREIINIKKTYFSNKSEEVPEKI